MSNSLTDTLCEAARLCKATRELRREWARRMRLNAPDEVDFKELLVAAEGHSHDLVIDWCELQQSNNDAMLSRKKGNGS
jgi:hypothetical protein